MKKEREYGLAWGRMGCIVIGGKNGRKNWEKLGGNRCPFFLWKFL